MKDTLKLLIAGILLTAIAPLVSANSYELYCLGRGESINFGQLCNPAMGIVNGPTNICVQLLPNGKICPTIINRCNAIPGQVCSQTNATRLDVDPPEIEILSPEEQGVYTTKSILLNVETNERADISFIENHRSSNNWKMICNNCFSRSRQRTFDEGLNDLTIRAIDRAGNIGYRNLTFYIDSKAPKIFSISPRSKSFASEIFEIEFDEANPETLVLSYGNSQTGFREKVLNINDDCSLDRRYKCSAQINLADYDNQEIEYEFIITDLAGQSRSKRGGRIKVDATFPIINSISHLLFGSNRAEITLEITEENFNKAVYINHAQNRPRETTFCSRVRNNLCKKRIPLQPGLNSIDFTVTDKAGNSIAQNYEIFV